MSIEDDLARAWLKQVAAAAFGVPAWSAPNMRRLVRATRAMDRDLLSALSLHPIEQTTDGRLIVTRAGLSTERAVFDRRKGIFETEDVVGFGIDGLAAWCWRPHAGQGFGSLDAAAVLAASLGLAELQLAERRGTK